MIFSGVVFLSFSSCWSAFVYINCVSTETSSLCCISFGHVPLNDVKVDIKEPKGRGSGRRISQDATQVKLWDYVRYLSGRVNNQRPFHLLPSKLNWKTGAQQHPQDSAIAAVEHERSNSFGSKSKSAEVIIRQKRDHDDRMRSLDILLAWYLLEWDQVAENNKKYYSKKKKK